MIANNIRPTINQSNQGTNDLIVTQWNSFLDIVGEIDLFIRLFVGVAHVCHREKLTI